MIHFWKRWLFPCQFFYGNVADALQNAQQNSRPVQTAEEIQGNAGWNNLGSYLLKLTSLLPFHFIVLEVIEVIIILQYLFSL
jgi:hypothetical protein